MSADLYDAEDNEDQLRERSENIGAARDAAFERGLDAYSAEGDRDALAAQYFDHPKLRADFCAGWDIAAQEELAVARAAETPA